MPNKGIVNHNVSLPNIVAENTEMIKTIREKANEIYRFFFGGGNQDELVSSKDDTPTCLMDDIDNQSLLLKQCIEILSSILQRLN